MHCHNYDFPAALKRTSIVVIWWEPANITRPSQNNTEWIEAIVVVWKWPANRTTIHSCKHPMNCHVCTVCDDFSVSLHSNARNSISDACANKTNDCESCPLNGCGLWTRRRRFEFDALIISRCRRVMRALMENYASQNRFDYEQYVTFVDQREAKQTHADFLIVSGNLWALSSA